MALDALGIIAGSRSLPQEIARAARAAGVRRLAAVGFEGETDPALGTLVDEITYLRVGQLSKMIRFFQQREITQCVMGGQIAPKNLFRLRPDWRAAALLLRLKEKNARTLFGAIANELQKEGIELIEATPWLRPLMPAAGFLLGAPLSPAQKADLRFGMTSPKRLRGWRLGKARSSSKARFWRWKALKERTPACVGAENWRGQKAAQPRQRRRTKITTCALTFPAWAKLRCKPVWNPGLRRWVWKAAE